MTITYRKPQLNKDLKLSERIYMTNKQYKDVIEPQLEEDIEVITKDIHSTLMYITRLLYKNDKNSDNDKTFLVEYISFYYCENNTDMKHCSIERKLAVYRFLNQFNENIEEASSIIHQLTPQSLLNKKEKHKEIYTIFTSVIYENLLYGKLPFDTFEQVQSEQNKVFMFDMVTYIKIYHNLLTLPSYKYRHSAYLVKKQKAMYTELMPQLANKENNREIAKNLIEIYPPHYLFYKSVYTYLNEGDCIFLCEEQKAQITYLVDNENNNNNLYRVLTTLTNKSYSLLSNKEKETLEFAYSIKIILDNPSLVTEEKYKLLRLCVSELQNSFGETYSYLSNFISHVEGSSCCADKARHIITTYVNSIKENTTTAQIAPTEIVAKQYTYHLPLVKDFMLWKEIIESQLWLSIDKTNIYAIVHSLTVTENYFAQTKDVYQLNNAISELCKIAQKAFKNEYLENSKQLAKLEKNINAYYNEMSATKFTKKYNTIFAHELAYKELFEPFIEKYKENKDAMYVLNLNHLYGNYKDDEAYLRLISENILYRIYMTEYMKQKYS